MESSTELFIKPLLSLQVLIKSGSSLVDAHTQMCAHTQRRKGPQFPFPRKQAWNKVIYSMAVLDVPGGSIIVRGDGEYWSWWQLAGLWGWMGQDVRRGGWSIPRQLPATNIVYLHPCSVKRWWEESNPILDFECYYYCEPWLLCLVEMPCLDAWTASLCFHHLECTGRSTTVPVWVLHPAEGQGELWGNAELARKVAVGLLENATEGISNTHKNCVNLAESLIQLFGCL